ncbi:hypothetical protein GGX14DRAFT_408887 [Mycena pura]|uniref:Uncharacterized protein n=1 Tax=Mycena pura TaxID=153505 RepID=A0AAD6UM06_9AGAR|nr:hypothetical protein GGX14DRAFT_408887 [Mycena pura]
MAVDCTCLAGTLIADPQWVVQGQVLSDPATKHRGYFLMGTVKVDIRPPTFERIRPSNNEPSLAQPVEEPLRSKREQTRAEKCRNRVTKARKRAKISLDTEQSGAELRNHNTSGRGKREGEQTGRRDFSTQKHPVEVAYDLYLTTRGYSMWTMFTYKPTT